MLNSISKAIISSAILITPFLATSQVQARDETVYDASACIVTSGGNFGTIRIISTGGLENVSTTNSLSVRCPISRNRNFGSVDPDNSYVLVRDNTPTGSVSCILSNNSLTTLFTNPVLNTAVIRASTSRASARNTYERLNFPNGAFKESEEGSWFVNCTLPPRVSTSVRGSAINSYYIDED